MKNDLINPLELPFETIPNRHALPKTSGVYFVLSESGEVLYIGISKNIFNRWRGHHICAELDSPKSCKVAYLLTDENLEELELLLIARFLPRLNSMNLPKPTQTFAAPPVMESEESCTPEGCFNVREVSSILNIARSTINLYCRQGRFPNAYQMQTRFGAFWVIPETDLPLVQKRGRGKPKTSNN